MAYWQTLIHPTTYHLKAGGRVLLTRRKINKNVENLKDNVSLTGWSPGLRTLTSGITQSTLEISDSESRQYENVVISVIIFNKKMYPGVRNDPPRVMSSPNRHRTSNNF